MKLTENPLVALIEESIRLKDSAQDILSDAVGSATLTRMERLILIMITESDAAMTASQISRHLGHSRQVVNRAANQLLELKLIRKLPNPDHKTAPLMVATSKGIEYENQLGEKMVNIVDSLLSESEKKMCLRIAKDLNKLRTRLENYQKENSKEQ